MFAAVGLGNPGAQYAATRHNAGRMVIDELAARARGKLSRLKNTGALGLECHVGPPPSRRAVLFVTTRYMNQSGGPVAALLGYFKIAPQNLIVVHDELDLPFGTIRLKRGGGEGGHNGLKSITQALGTKEYIRLRFGIGRPPGRQDPADFVLSPFASSQAKELPLLISEAADAVEDAILSGLEAAQLRLHTR